MAHMYGSKKKRPGKKLAAIAALILVVTLLLGGAYAWRDYTQHKTNELSGDAYKHEIRLVEDFEEVDDWQQDQEIDKRIRVTNVGRSEMGYQDVYARIQLKEYMEIGSLVYEQTAKRYMVDPDTGRFLTYETPEKAREDWGEREYKLLEDKVTGDSGWMVPTDAKDPDGQYGKHVVTGITEIAGASVIPNVVRASDDAKKAPDGKHDVPANEIRSGHPRNGECDYTVHPWTTSNAIADYIEWNLGDAHEYLSDWTTYGGSIDPHTGPFWLIDDLSEEGWIYWMQPIPPNGGVTADFLKSVTLIHKPEGPFYYAIHTELEGYSLEQLPPEWPIRPDSYSITGITVEPSGPIDIYNPETGYQLFTAVVHGTGLVPQGVSWSVSSHISNGAAIISPNGLLYYSRAYSSDPSDYVVVRATSVADPRVYTDVRVDLGTIVFDMPYLTVSPGEPLDIRPGDSQQFTATMHYVFIPSPYDEVVDATWQVIENLSANTTISASGLLTVASDEKADFVFVRAVYNGYQAYVRVDTSNNLKFAVSSLGAVFGEGHLIFNKTPSPPILNSAPGDVFAYSIDNASAATVDPVTGELDIQYPPLNVYIEPATVTATVISGPNAGKSCSFEIHVSEIRYPPPRPREDGEDPFFWLPWFHVTPFFSTDYIGYTFTKTPNMYGTIQYSIDNTSVATIDAATGEVTLQGGFGSATVTATATSGVDVGKTCTYSLDVYDPIAN